LRAVPISPRCNRCWAIRVCRQPCGTFTRRTSRLLKPPGAPKPTSSNLSEALSDPPTARFWAVVPFSGLGLYRFANASFSCISLRYCRSRLRNMLILCLPLFVTPLRNLAFRPWIVHRAPARGSADRPSTSNPICSRFKRGYAANKVNMPSAVQSPDLTALRRGQPLFQASSVPSLAV
jgi:hypothetical protein